MKNIISIDKLIAHHIVAKDDKQPCYADFSESLLSLSDNDKGVFIKRVQKALDSKTKTFQLEYGRKDEESVFSRLKSSDIFSDTDKFINFSKDLADELSNCQDKKGIPGGYFIVFDGKVESGKHYVCMIKADDEDVFNVEKNALKLVENVFLSPAKDFYKIGFFIETRKGNYDAFVYDDQFSLQKKDLTVYFYNEFLGLSTSTNASLNTKNVYLAIREFINNEVKDAVDKTEMLKALRIYFRENPKQVISAKEFSQNYFHGLKEEEIFEKKVVRKYPNATTLDVSLLPSEKLQRVKLGEKITLITHSGMTIKTYDGMIPEGLFAEIDNKVKRKIVVLEEAIE